MAETINEQEQPKSKRDLALERLRGRYPEESFDDDEAIYGRMMDDYDANEKELGELRENTDKLTTLFNENPEWAGYLTDMANGRNPVTAYIQRYGDSLRDMLDDPDKQEEYANAQKEYMAKVAKEAEYEKEYEQNLEQTLTMLDELESEGVSSDQIDKAFERIQLLAQNALMGKISREDIELMSGALNHDKDVAAAAHEGRVAGRNEKIDMQLRKAKRGDGTAAAMGGRNGVPERRRQSNSIFDTAREAM